MNDTLFNDIWTCPSEKKFTYIYDELSKLLEELKNDPNVTIKQFNPFTNEWQTVKLDKTTNTLTPKTNDKLSKILEQLKNDPLTDEWQTDKTPKNNMNNKNKTNSSYDKELIQRALNSFKNNNKKHVDTTADTTDEYKSPNTVITDLPSTTIEEKTESITEKVADSQYEYVNHPQHYNKYPIETIEIIERIYGPEKTALWCEITALKYRLRMGNKPNEDLLKDINKEQWYLAKAEELRSKF